ncbi:MAG: hypothetical protein OIF38_02870, partial [Cellvibrionaceae bacterium]|nr:hypothetical protein [Cellvibrionaceae bacterium]
MSIRWRGVYSALLGLIYLCLAVEVAAKVQPQAFFRHLDDKGAIRWGVVEKLAQDTQGFIWVSTQAGLLRHDGYTFKPYRHPQHNPKSRNSVLFAASDGRVFAGYVDGLAVYQPELDQIQFMAAEQQPSEAMSSQNVQQIIEQPGTGFWLASATGLELVDYQLQLRKRYRAGSGEHGLSANYLLGVQQDHNKNLWVATERGIDFIDGRS